MRRARWMLVTAVSLTMLVTVPAFGGDTILKRVKKLERRVNALAVLVVENNDVRTRTVESAMQPRGGGLMVGTAYCGAGEATGGGVVWKGGALAAGSFVHFSNQVPGGGWTAGVNSAGASAVPYVQVVCTDLD